MHMHEVFLFFKNYLEVRVIPYKMNCFKLNIHYLHHVLQPPFTSISKIFSSSPKETLHPLSSCSLFFLLQASDNHRYMLCLYMDLPILDIFI